jgi:type I restriction-modification system DNA methylase subunit
MIKGGGYLEWRRRLIKGNTLLAVVTFPSDLFYPVGVHTLGLFVKKGVPHAGGQNVLWLRAIRDGRLKKKGKRLENLREEDDLGKVLPVLKRFIANQKLVVVSVPMLQKADKIDSADKALELVPEAYLDEAEITPQMLDENIEQLIRDNIAFHIRYETKIRAIH